MESRELMYWARDAVEACFREVADESVLQHFAALGSGVLKVDLLQGTARLSNGTNLPELGKKLQACFRQRVHNAQIPEAEILEARMRGTIQFRDANMTCVAGTGAGAFVLRRGQRIGEIRGKSIVRSKVLRVWSPEPWSIEHRWFTGNHTRVPVA